MKIITLTNQKGGCGKTTTAVALASILTQKHNKKALLVDVDPQCNSTDTYRAETDGVATLYDLLLDEDPCTLEEAIQRTEFGDIIAGDPLLTKADDALYNHKDRYFRLKQVLSGLTERFDYDYVILDTNPSLNTLLKNALTCTDEVILPCKLSRYAVQGLSALSETVLSAKRETNPNLHIAGILRVDFDSRANVYKDVRIALSTIAQQMGTKTFNVTIRHSAKVEEAQMRRCPLINYAPKSNPEIDYEQFVEELMGEL